MKSRGFLASVKRHDWTSAVSDFVIVVLGIFIGLQANQWVQARQDVAIERSYLERLLVDSDANIRVLEQAIDGMDKRISILSSLASGLERGGQIPDRADLSRILCRWFIQPAVNVRLGTYQELVSSGRLALLRDQDLRNRLALEEGARGEAERLDILTPAILQASAPLNDYRRWRIVARSAAPAGGVDCDFDLAGMRADARVPSVIAQLYREQQLHKAFRQSELAAVRSTRLRLSQLLSRR